MYLHAERFNASRKFLKFSYKNVGIVRISALYYRRCKNKDSTELISKSKFLVDRFPAGESLVVTVAVNFKIGIVLLLLAGNSFSIHAIPLPVDAIFIISSLTAATLSKTTALAFYFHGLALANDKSKSMCVVNSHLFNANFVCVEANL